MTSYQSVCAFVLQSLMRFWSVSFQGHSRTNIGFAESTHTHTQENRSPMTCLPLSGTHDWICSIALKGVTTETLDTETEWEILEMLTQLGTELIELIVVCLSPHTHKHTWLMFNWSLQQGVNVQLGHSPTSISTVYYAQKAFFLIFILSLAGCLAF